MILATVDLRKNSKSVMVLNLKTQILEQLISKVKSEIAILEKASEATHSLATDSEFKAESKYDTRALEASYLAGAEAKRVEELKLELQMLEEVDITLTQKLNEITIGSIVQLKFKDQIRDYFLIPTAGGLLVDVGGKGVLVVSVFSPLGDAMLGLKKGEEFEVETPKESRIYQIMEVH